MKTRKLKIVITVCLMVAPGIAVNYGQDAATLIPFLERINTTNVMQLRQDLAQQRSLQQIAATQKRIAVIQAKLEKAKDNAGKIAKLQSYRKLYKIVGNMACTIRNLEAVLQLSGDLSNNCVFKFDYDLALARYQFAMDGLATVVGVGVLMSTSESLKTIDDVNNSLEQANARLNQLTAVLTGNLINNGMNALKRVQTKEDLTQVGFSQMNSPLN